MALNTKSSVLRSIDANLNRAAEGLRVVEDILRFSYNEKRLTTKARSLRRSIRTTGAMLPGGAAALCGSRDSIKDVARNAGASLGRNAADSITPNLKRAQEACRVLEELSRPISSPASSKFGEIRFELYDFERDAALFIAHADRKLKMPPFPFLYAIAGYEVFSRSGYKYLKELCAAKSGMIQLRDKNVSDLESTRRAKDLSDRLKTSDTLFIMNDRLDIAMISGADGVHLGDEDIPVIKAREIAGADFIIGTSTHSYEQAMGALEGGPDYIAFGPVFESPTKPGRKPVGVKLLKKISARAADTPVVAIGGITPDRLASVYESGAAGAAMISSISDQKSRKKNLESISKIIESFKRIKSKNGYRHE